MMGLLESLGMSGLMGQNHQQLAQQANQAFNHAYSQYSGQMGQSLMQQQYNQSLMQQQTRWMFNGVVCSGPREMADIIWPNDCAEKTHFLLKYE